jgi:hypothetical protein
MSGRKDTAREALRGIHLHPAQHEDVVNALDAAGLLDNPRGNGCAGIVCVSAGAVWVLYR